MQISARAVSRGHVVVWVAHAVPAALPRPLPAVEVTLEAQLFGLVSVANVSRLLPEYERICRGLTRKKDDTHVAAKVHRTILSADLRTDQFCARNNAYVRPSILSMCPMHGAG